MRTLVAGAVSHSPDISRADGAVVAAIWSPLIAVAYLVSLPIAADINFLSERSSQSRGNPRARMAALPS